MADARESSRRPPSTQTVSHLQYPTLPPLTASVEEWLSRSRPANKMISDIPADLPSKSLSDSWANLSVSDMHSEDGNRSEQTDIASLIDQTTPDDVASLDDQESNSEADGPEQEYLFGYDEGAHEEIQALHALATSQQFPSPFAHPGSAIDDSNLTTRPSFRQSLDSIEFVEPEKWPEMERVELKHTIHVFNDESASEMMNRLPYNQAHSMLLATVQQTMTKQSLDLDKPFRVLYLGNPDYRNIILDKIGDVLVSSSNSGSPSSSTESSRYHVVPTSFGAGAVPNFAELLPIHVQLVVDECTEASSDSRGDLPSTLHLGFKNRPPCRSWWVENEYQVSSASDWTLPDVAIIFVSTRDDKAAVKTRRLAHMFLERHGIPAMVISEEQIWKRAGEAVPLNHHSLHMCLESRHAETGETAVLKRYPIDLKTFESITPSQLNRNLASLMDIYPKRPHKAIPDIPKSTEQSSYIDPGKKSRNWIPPTYAAWAHELNPLLRLITLALISAVTLSIGYSALKAVSILFTQWIAGSALSHSPSQPSTTASIPSTALILEGVRQTSLSLRPSGDLDLGDALPPDFITPLSAGSAIASSSSSAGNVGFEIQVVGDCHLVIKPPRSFASTKKKRRFNVSVHRNDRSLPCEMDRLFDDVYTLRLDREDAYGLINVTITAKSKPPVNQIMTVDLGTPWLKIASWRRAARNISAQFTKDLQVAQTGLSEVYGRLCTDLQVLMGDVVKRSHFLWEDAERLGIEGLHAGDSVLSRSKQLSERITRTAVQRFQSISSVLQSRSVTVNREAKEIMNNAWDRLGRSTANIDLHPTLDRVQSVKVALYRAQTRARHFVGRREKKKLT